ncbi:MAG: hypothetical protein KJZ86_14270 [Caldilineaceae bacterium]|nr:hypothetical protein [Caldilineaceae bacterium]
MREILILAMTRMKSGICTAGIVAEPHPESVHAWVRPVKEFGTLLLGDMTTAGGQVVRVNDVVSLNLLRPRPDPVHAEDWITDFVKQPPRILRRLQGEKRADFFASHIDRRPAQVVVEHSRSLCIVQPMDFWCDFFWDHYSGKYQARMGYHLDPRFGKAADAPTGLIVTDLAWRGLGREWLTAATPQPARPVQTLRLDRAEILERLGAETLYLSIGLSRVYGGGYPALVVGVHPVPDYDVAIDYHTP